VLLNIQKLLPLVAIYIMFMTGLGFNSPEPKILHVFWN